MFTTVSPRLGSMAHMREIGRRREKGIKALRARTRIGYLAAGVAATAMLAVAVLASSASAVTGGQIGEAFGKAGSATGSFVTPGMLGVDTSDGSIYTGEAKDETHYRIQKFTSSGEFKASVEFTRLAEKKLFTVHGIAVDPSLHRFYVVEGCRLKKPAVACESIKGGFGARQILVFSTEQSGTALKAASPATLPLPGGEETIYEPQTIAVDPNTHDLVVLGENFDGHLVVQRISSAGVAGARFVDTGDELRPPTKEAYSLAVGPDGTTYLLTGGPGLSGAQNTRAWQLPLSLAGPEPVPGFAEAAESEAWATGLLAPKSSTEIGGPQLAISPDGSTLYWKEAITVPENQGEAGNVLVRGFSLAKHETTALYGNGSNAKKRCLIQTPEAGIAAVGENLVVFDYGPGEESTAFGSRVMTFGAAGTECRSPVGKFTVNGSEGEATVAKGTSVAFDASGSELLGLVAEEYDWEFGDGTVEKVTGSPAKKTTAHTFAAPGTYRVTLRAKLEQSDTANFGDPLPVTRLVKVTGGTLAKLTVSKAGSGFGSVSSSPGGVSCGADCDQEFETGKEVTLTATAASGSKFSGWSGSGCSGTSTCTVTMTEAKAVAATFDPVAKKKLTVVKEGSGTGVVTSVPSGIDCRKDCEQEYEAGKEVTLTETPVKETNTKFVEWSGACSGVLSTCKVTMSEARTVKAIFTSEGLALLKVKIIGSGKGKVASIPTGINCEPSCEHNFSLNQSVELVQGAEEGSSFVKWGGDCSGTGVCNVTMSATKEVTAEFKSNVTPKFKLKVTKIGSGTGEVTGPGIACPGDCEEEFTEGEEPELKAKATGESEFVKWGSACTGSASTCKVAMTANKEATAEFKSTAAKPKFKLKVTRTGSGASSGKVTSLPAGIICPSTCEAEFEESKEVTLEEGLTGEAEFVKWGGACTGTAKTCKVTMTAAKEVTAEFKSTVKVTPKLKVGVIGAGSGKVTGPGISCPSDCEEVFTEGTAVELTATANAGSEFVKWGGACAGSEKTCKVTMTTAKEVTAEFKSTVKSKFKLTVTKSGSGTGTVASGDGQVNCGSDCEGEYEEGAKVTLTAAAAAGSEFKGWNGACSGTGACEVAMGAAKVVGAEFATAPPPEEEVKKPPVNKLKQAIKKCKKLKNKKARAKCIKRAKKKFGRHTNRHVLRGRDRG